MAWDQGEQAKAQHTYRVALTAAREAGDSAIAACARTYMSYAAAAQGDVRQAQARRSYSRPTGRATAAGWTGR